jgi:hypothetical protein
MELVRTRVNLMMTEMQERFDLVCGNWESKLERLHSENRARLQHVDHEVKSNGQQLADVAAELTRQGVKLDALYGNGTGRKGAVEKLTDKLDTMDDKFDARMAKLGEMMSVGVGIVLAAAAGIGWFVSMHR